MEFNKHNMKKIKELIIFAILIFLGVQNLDMVLNGAGWVFNLIFPFILGACLAFIINVPMRIIEKKFKCNRGMSLVVTLVLLAAVIFIVLFLVVPELGRTIAALSDNIPAFLLKIQKWAEDMSVEYPDIFEQISAIEINWRDVGESIFDFFKTGAGNVLTSTLTMAKSLVSGVTTFFVALMFSFYVLLQKEKLGSQVAKLLYAYFPEEAAHRLISVAALASRTFSNFLSVQCAEAVILGVMFFITMTIFRFPYALMTSVLIAFTALIPIFGSFIGCAVGTFLILMVSPIQAFWFLVLFIVLQQIEGNLIYPHVVGNSVGLPSMWVLVAVTLGGNTMGVAGMLIFIPLCSVLYTLLRESVHKRLEEKEKKSVKRKRNKDQ